MRTLVFFFFSSLLLAHPFSADIEKTFLEARKEKKPLFIDFFGIWCPPCNELDETVFESTDFLKKSKAFKLLKVDADAESSWKIKSRYHVGGYPTIVMTDPKGNEIYRIVGYRTQKEVLRIMDLVLSAKGEPLEKACHSQKADSLWRCAVVCSERKDGKCLESSLKKLEGKLTPGTAVYELARTLAVENAATEDLKRNGYEQLMTEFPTSPAALGWATAYFDLQSDGARLPLKRELIENVLAQFPLALKDPRQEELGIPKTDMFQIKADLLDKLGKKEEAKKAWIEAAQTLEKFSQALPKNTIARGFTLERISCLDNAGESEAALKLANTYRALFPKEFTFHYSVAGLLDRQKKYGEAIKAAKEAYQYSYGDNKIRVTTLLVNLYATVPDKASAKKLVEEITKEFNPTPELAVRTHRYLIKLQEALLKF